MQVRNQSNIHGGKTNEYWNKHQGKSDYHVDSDAVLRYFSSLTEQFPFTVYWSHWYQAFKTGSHAYTSLIKNCFQRSYWAPLLGTGINKIEGENRSLNWVQNLRLICDSKSKKQTCEENAETSWKQSQSAHACQKKSQNSKRQVLGNRPNIDSSDRFAEMLYPV